MIKVRKLNCGLRVVMEEIPHVQSVSIGVWTATGSINETKDIAGISHLIEHMMFKGTEDRTAKEIAEAVDRIGGQINAFTGKESTCYYIKTLASNTEKAAEILLDMFLNSLFDKVELDKEKQVIYEEIKMIEDTPDEDVHDILCEQIFKGNPYGRSIIGTPSSLKSISRNKIKTYIDRQYTRNSIVIAVSGKFDEERICALFEDKLHDLKESKIPPVLPSVSYSTSHKVKQKEVEQSHICIGLPAISLLDEDYYTYVLLNNMIGGTMSSRLFQRIREEKGLAYAVYSVLSCFRDEGLFNIYAGVSHDKVSDALEGIRDELYNILDKGFEEEELLINKEQLKSSYIFRQENVTGRMVTIGRNLLLLDKVIEAEEVIEAVDKVSLKDISKAAERICNIKDYSSVVISDKRRNVAGILYR